MHQTQVSARLRSGLMIAASLLVPALSGCAPAGVSRTPSEAGPRTKHSETTAQEYPQPGPDEERLYDLDAEEQQEPFAGAGYVEEDFEPLANDTFQVEEAEPAAPQAVYGIGYRVQVFAAAELEAARELKKKVMAGTGLAAYIEYENGLYKVRAGDFATRDEAAAARAALSGEYPGCWIVQTTIETGR